ncbi:MAG TPA: L,D-transpeptidase family protein, partial [Polyangiaceae bacterium]|nr:L,D-transpeptidase family protein [Polyangiaceae bacterium]
MKKTFVLAVAVLSGCSAEPDPRPSRESESPPPAPGFALPKVAPAPSARVSAELEIVAEPPAPGKAGEKDGERAAGAGETNPGEVTPSEEKPSTPAAPPTLDSEPGPEVAHDGPLLFAAAREVFVYERPSFASKKLGYLRAGAQVKRGSEAAGHERCPRGFYRVSPQGYVCVGDGARLEPGAAVSELARVRPDRSGAMPYVYGRSRQPPPPLYVKLPTDAEQRAVEPELSSISRTVRGTLANFPLSSTPARLEAGQQLPTPFGYAYEPSLVSTGRALSDSAFALLEVVQQGTRKFALTSDLLLVPLDRLEAVSPSSFHGVTLESEAGGLPVAFVMSRAAFAYAGEAGQSLRPVRPLAYREGLLLSGKSLRASGTTWLETRAGEWIRDERLVRIEPDSEKPAWATPGRSWMRVSISKQTLVAYEGDKPVYATLVSTGVDGLGDPETTRSTVRGQFLIHTKHVSVTMNSEEAGSEFDLRDVPYVQYFKDNYALHAAYWHDGFGA